MEKEGGLVVGALDGGGDEDIRVLKKQLSDLQS